MTWRGPGVVIKLVIKFTNVFVKDLQKLPDHAPMTRSEFDNAYKDFVHNSSTIPKLPWKLKAMNKRESCDMLTDLVMNTYWSEGWNIGSDKLHRGSSTGVFASLVG